MMSPADRARQARLNAVTATYYPTIEEARAVAATLPTPRDPAMMWGVVRSPFRDFRVTQVTRARQQWVPPPMPCADGSPDPYDE